MNKRGTGKNNCRVERQGVKYEYIKENNGAEHGNIRTYRKG